MGQKVKELKSKILMQIGTWIFMGLYRTMRFRVSGMDLREKAKNIGPNGAHIIALWHENAFGCVTGHLRFASIHFSECNIFAITNYV